MSTPRTDLPQYKADEEHDGKTPKVPVTHAEPDQPDPDPQSGSGIVDLGAGRPKGEGKGADASNHGSA